MSERINHIFSKIYRQYDFMNHFYSMGIDISWRKSAALKAIIPKKSFRVLDVATGTGDLAIDIARQASKERKEVSIVGMDFNKKMLEVAKRKIDKRNFGNIRVELGDALKMRYPSGSFDVLVSGFVLRNVDDLDIFARQIYRVLKKNGRIVLLDMARPDNPAQLFIFNTYFGLMRLAAMFADKEAYDWLVYSIGKFDKKACILKIKRAGFRNVRIESLRSGVAFLITAEK
ncbi:MAG: ubiquinone/menaquinone biosynthesis methyltransferase [Candidatus Micrarchaeota archaeon]|nr:ubiquinone/menaquinone biosynthesis methyltransferase [Candidatus Micrarchaeota archaeon]MDE1848372.1 ubiquinone/menaquinone biosynthesis methyltransferase [Candidatus Micrarchaeota archaeon]MDE1864809.1 ubiquinone/menaquinone biosynthesis methyltransferase [Candidatus Micrarchaeota archaeon]